jgi:hypothetical protein
MILAITNEVRPACLAQYADHRRARRRGTRRVGCGEAVLRAVPPLPDVFVEIGKAVYLCCAGAGQVN